MQSARSSLSQRIMNNCCDEGTCRQGRDHPPRYNKDVRILALIVLMYWAAVMIIVLLR